MIVMKTNTNKVVMLPTNKKAYECYSGSIIKHV